MASLKTTELNIKPPARKKAKRVAKKAPKKQVIAEVGSNARAKIPVQGEKNPEEQAPTVEEPQAPKSETPQTEPIAATITPKRLERAGELPRPDEGLVASRIQYRKAEHSAMKQLRGMMTLGMDELLGEMSEATADPTETSFPRILLFALLVKTLKMKERKDFVQNARSTPEYVANLRLHLEKFIKENPDEVKTGLIINSLQFDGRRSYTEGDLEAFLGSIKST